MSDDETVRRLGANASVIDEFRANGGKVGGDYEGVPLVLLHSTGARTGAERVSPVMYLADGDRYAVFASNAGRDRNPGWYHNVVAHPDVTIEVGTESVAVHAEVTEESERRRLYDLQAERFPVLAAFERSTDRRIPVVVLVPQR